MSAAPTLFLLTNVFPLSKGEEFIENEIEHLSRAFQRVIIVAAQTKPGDVVTRTVPDNVEVVTAGAVRPTGRAAIPAILSGLRHLPRSGVERSAFSLKAPVLSREGMAETCRAAVRDAKVLAVDALFEERARRSADALAPQLPGLRLEPGSHAVIYSFWFHVQARLAMLLAEDLRARGVVVDRIVSRAHRYDLYESETVYGHIPQRRLLLETLDGVFPVSEQGTRELRERWPGYADKISTRHLGTADPEELAACSTTPFHLVSCSHLVPVKRVDRMPAILAGLRAKGIDAVWTHLGDGPEMASVTRAVAAAGVEEWTDLRGYVHNTEIAQVERDLRPSCFINLSTSEGLPVSMMEVAALGIPIVATEVGGVAEIVHDGENGRLLPAGFTDQQAVEALAWLAGLDENAFQEVCSASRRVWEAGFDQAKVYPAFCTEVLGAQETPGAEEAPGASEH